MQLCHVLPLFDDQTSSSMRSPRQKVKTIGQPVSLQTIRHQVSISSLDSICFPYWFRCCSMRDIAPSLRQQSPRAGEDLCQRMRLFYIVDELLLGNTQEFTLFFYRLIFVYFQTDIKWLPQFPQNFLAYLWDLIPSFLFCWGLFHHDRGSKVHRMILVQNQESAQRSSIVLKSICSVGLDGHGQNSLVVDSSSHACLIYFP